jgi:HD-like signal output (HDOD) protein
MSAAAVSVFNTLAAQDSLPYLSAVAIELMQALANEEASLSQISDFARRDPALAAKILTAANVARRPGSLLVTRMEQAIGLLGRQRLATLCQIAALSNFNIHTKAYRKSVHFLEAFTTGLITEHLAKLYAPELSPELAYVCGALCNVGKLLGALVDDTMTDRIYTRTQEVRAPLTWTAAEDELGSPSHTVLGEIACVLWGLPEDVFGTALDHHRPLQPSKKASTAPDKPSTESLACLVTFANQLTHCVLLNSHRIDEAIMQSCLDRFKISDTEFKHMTRSLSPAAEHSRTFLESI